MTTMPNDPAPASLPGLFNVPRMEHVNVQLVGELAVAAQGRELPGGDWVSTFQTSMRTELTATGHKERNDRSDCVALTAGAPTASRLQNQGT